nr:RES domain-containing protein [Ferrovibrio sp.]
MKAYRIGDRRHPLLDGTGAALRGGRWNSPGRRIIYAAASLAVARLELLVHLPFGGVPASQVWIEIVLPDASVESLDERALPGWNGHDYAVARRAGDAWADERRSLCLSVPSVPAGGERNLLINQDHPDFAQITSTQPQPLIWDERLFRR